MKKFYALLLSLLSIMLATMAGYFSVFGLSKLFLGASVAVIIMAATMELSKVVIVSLLHQQWKNISKVLKTYLITAVIILMIITSVGVYGFLSNAYSKISVEIGQIDSDIQQLDIKILQLKNEKERLYNTKNIYDNRIEDFDKRRISLSVMLDTMYQRNHYSNARRVENDIKIIDDNVYSLNNNINNVNKQISSLDSIIVLLDSEKINVSFNKLSGEVGPLKYIASLTNTDMNIIVNYLILFLVIVFDPLVVALIIASSSMFKLMLEDNKIKNNIINDKKQYVDNVEENLQAHYNITELHENTKKQEENTENYIKQSEKENIILNKTYNIDKDYVEGGIFTASTKTLDENISNIETSKETLNIKLLNIMFKDNTKKINDNIPTYNELKSDIEKNKINITDKEIKDFIVICDLLKIISFKDNIGIFIKSYEDSKNILLKI